MCEGNLREQERLLGIIEEVSEDKKANGPLHYFSRHPVLTPRKTTTKLTIVFDVSARAKNGQKLKLKITERPNEVLLVETTSVAVVFEILRYGGSLPPFSANGFGKFPPQTWPGLKMS
ncbi:unnamed protein product [Anisakis simplex]|uniref:Uncharacterized protein n=1 Tax=Anisakis simplex TaxID=6269 RepID=A0A0M3JE71_ANISI|nr:unnamed protein product [Anisakis simplex]